MNGSLKFKCPACKIAFEFDWIGENELVSCPICGNDFVTVRKGNGLILEPFEFKKSPNLPNITVQSQILQVSES